MRSFVCALAGALLLAAPLSAQPAADPLIGLWVSTQNWDTGPSGELAVSASPRVWHASLSGLGADFQIAGSRLAFEFPDHRGTFRGALSDDKATISGFWIQPHGAAGDPRDPDGQGQTYASPLTLTRGVDGVWRGLVVPLRDTFTLYLRIFRDADGALIGAFRNPEMNFRAGAAQFHVTQMHSTVSFAADPAHPDKALSAIYDAHDATLQIRFPGLDQAFVLKRATPAEASGFFPRSPDAPPYTYRPPQSTGDGWTVARAGDAGFDEAKLASLVQSIIAVDPAAKRPDLIDSLLIARHGKLVLDEYFEGYDRDTPHDLRSAGKTFSSVMLGALMHEGAPISPDTHLYPLVAGMGPFSNPDPRKGQITLAQLMTHTSGLACDDNDDASPGNEDTLQSQRKERNWWKYTLDVPVVHDPGTRYAYCSGGMNLMGAALTTAAQESLPELFDRTIARPLGWGPYYWNVMPNGQGYLGGGSFVRPRDFLKLGQAYLDGGVWNGRRLVDASWVERSTRSYVAINPSTTGLSAEQFPNFYVPAEDGYAWHLAELRAPGRDYHAYGASGNGGQLLIVVPELDLAVVFTGSNYQQGLIWNAWRDRIIPTEIIPAMSDLAVH